MKVLKSASKYSLKLVKESDEVYQYKSELNSPDELANYVRGVFKMDELAEEIFVVVCLNVKNNVIANMEVSHGSLSGTNVHPREVFKRALIANSSKILLAHNHPSGDTTPSREDKETTKILIEAGEILGIQILDHIIVSENGFRSMNENSDCQF